MKLKIEKLIEDISFTRYSEEIENTTVHRVYNALRKIKVLSCAYCRPNKGCNATSRKEYRNWKKSRVYQWKEKRSSEF